MTRRQRRRRIKTLHAQARRKKRLERDYLARRAEERLVERERDAYGWWR